MKKIVILTLLLSTYTVWGQGRVTTATFRPMTYEQLVTPIMNAQSAYDNALSQFQNYIDKANTALNNSNYHSAKSYFTSAIQLNNRWNGNLYSSEDLKNYVEYCDQKIEDQAYNNALTQFNDYIDKANQALNNNQYYLAKFYIERAIQLNDEFVDIFYSPKELKKYVDYCDEKMAEQKK